MIEAVFNLIIKYLNLHNNSVIYIVGGPALEMADYKRIKNNKANWCDQFWLRGSLQSKLSGFRVPGEVDKYDAAAEAKQRRKTRILTQISRVLPLSKEAAISQSPPINRDRLIRLMPLWLEQTVGAARDTNRPLIKESY